MSMPFARTVGLAVAAILLADFLLTFNDALVNVAQSQHGLAAVFWGRALVAVPLLLGVMAVQSAPIWPNAPGLVILRSGLLLVSWASLYTAFQYLPVANVVATAYTNPIIIAVAILVLDRKALPRSVWVAIAVGFVGAVLIVQPAQGTLHWAYGLAVLAAASYSAAMILTNRRLGQETPQTISLWLNLAFMAGGFVGVLALGTNPVSLATTLAMTNPWPFVVMGCLVAVAGTAVAFAFQNAPPPLIATFDYSYLLFSIFWGFVFFNQTPNALAVLGMACIVTAGALVLWRRS